MLVVLVLAGAVGCSGGGSAGVSPLDQRFVAEVHRNAPDVQRYKSDGTLIGLGAAACDGFRSGASTVQVADRLELAESSPALPPSDLGAVLAAAVAVLCPQFHGRIAPLSNG